MSIAIGIVSWFPNKEPARGQRIARIKRLFKQIEELFPSFPIIVIAQDWNGFMPNISNPMHIYQYGRLGILNARKELRKKFLELNYDYIIMFDDDAIISCENENDLKEYIQRINDNPQGFAFCKTHSPEKNDSPYNPYCDSQLNLCAVSRYIYGLEDIPDVNPQNSVAYEDRLFSMLLHIKYADKEFDVPDGLKCIHFRNKSKPLPSTWANSKKCNWWALDKNTIAIEKYICDNKDLPENIENFLEML